MTTGHSLTTRLTWDGWTWICSCGLHGTGHRRRDQAKAAATVAHLALEARPAVPCPECGSPGYALASGYLACTRPECRHAEHAGAGWANVTSIGSCWLYCIPMEDRCEH